MQKQSFMLYMAANLIKFPMVLQNSERAVSIVALWMTTYG